jgi:hypothetical protein
MYKRLVDLNRTKDALTATVDHKQINVILGKHKQAQPKELREHKTPKRRATCARGMVELVDVWV